MNLYLGFKVKPSVNIYLRQVVHDLLLRAKYTIRLLGGSPLQWFGLETSNLIIEYVPLFLPQRQNQDRLERI